MIVVCDGLRPDMLTPELTPHLARFRSEGCNFPHSRAVFPSMTRVNASALVTGANTAAHGIVANAFYDPHVFRDKLVSGNKAADIDAGRAAYGRRMVFLPTLGELAAERGLRMAVVSTGTSGTARLLNPDVKALGHVTLCLREWESSIPAGYAKEILRRFGPIPPAARPNNERVRLQTDIFLDGVFPEFEPDISILWYSDPDGTSHQCGLGSLETKQAIANVDAQLGRIIDWSRASGLEDTLQIIVLSDHGHLTARRKIPLKEELARAGFKFASHFESDGDYVASLAYTGAVWVRGHDHRLGANFVDWLAAQPWAGMIFTAGAGDVQGTIPGTFHRALALADHPRAPDVYFTMATDDALDADGIAGGCCFSDSYPEGGSVHGGLHPMELNNLLMMRGSLFKERYRSPYPCGIIDVVPTILYGFGLRAPSAMHGRCLVESMVMAPAELPEVLTEERASEGNGRRQHLRYSRCGQSVYLDAGWVEIC